MLLNSLPSLVEQLGLVQQTEALTDLAGQKRRNPIITKLSVTVPFEGMVRAMKVFKFWFSVIVFMLIATAAIGYGWLRSSLPQLDGTIELASADGTITIARDERGIPHISADNEKALFYAMGFVHAQDRLWQMEMNRRIGHGRVAEILGESGLGFDKYFRTLGFSSFARSAYEALDADTKDSLHQYAAGVNAFLEAHRGALPPEFILTGTDPEPWHPVDTLVWQKLMWLDLSSNMRQELARANLLTKLTPSQVESIYPPYPGDPELPLPALASLFEGMPFNALASAFGPEKPAGYGSNNWVIDGDRTTSGKPLLANDPHLGLTAPSIWYLVRLHDKSTGSNLVGVGFPGTPSIVLGRNDTIAWGFTNTAPDSQDLFIEKLVGDDSYLTPEGPARFVTRREVIKVRGGDDVFLNVRETRHGPVISDVIADQAGFLENGHVLSLQWTALRESDQGVSGLFGLAHAKTFSDFKAAGQLYSGPQQNMIYADTSGNIGYYAPALVPIRHPDNEIKGRLPSPGWDAKYDWQGFLPYNELPERFNPEAGIIATANEKIVDDNYPHYITGDWSLPYRGNRIRSLLQTTDKHDLESFVRIQSDVTSDMVRDVLPHILASLPSDSTPLGTALKEWDGHMDAERPEPLIFYSWLRNYQHALMADELGEDYDSFNRIRPRLIKSSLYWARIGRGDGGTDTYGLDYDLEPIPENLALPWCDDVGTADTTETCLDLARTALNETMADLSAKYGEDWRSWRWGDEHILTQTHRPMSQIPFLSGFFELTSAVSGGSNTINVAGVSQSASRLHRSTFGPSYRGIFDLSNLEKSLYTHPTGQSGNPFSRHYGDLFPSWLEGNYFTIETASPIPENVQHILTIKPTGNKDG